MDQPTAAVWFSFSIRELGWFGQTLCYCHLEQCMLYVSFASCGQRVSTNNCIEMELRHGDATPPNRQAVRGNPGLLPIS